MEGIVIDFYTNLLTSHNPNMGDILKVFNLISLVVTQEMNTSLDLPFSSEEIKKSLFDLNPNKAPVWMALLLSFFKTLGILLVRI